VLQGDWSWYCHHPLVSCNPWHDTIHLGLGKPLPLLAICRCYPPSATLTPEVGFWRGGRTDTWWMLYLFDLWDSVYVYIHKFVWSNNSVVDAGTGLCAGPLRSFDLIVAAKCPHWLWGIPTLLFCVCTWGGVSLGASGRIMDHASTSVAGNKNVWSCSSTPVSCHGMHETTVLLYKSFNSFKFEMYFS
jgi:hypothetical protein